MEQTNAEHNVAALLDARRVVEASTLDPQPFVFTTIFILTEQVQGHGVTVPRSYLSAVRSEGATMGRVLERESKSRGAYQCRKP